MPPIFAKIRRSTICFWSLRKIHGVTKGGSSYLTLKLLDRSGEIEARIWDRADDLGRGFERNDFVRVRGQATLYQGKMQIRVQDVMRVEESKVAAEDFLPKSAFEPDAMLEELQSILPRDQEPAPAGPRRSFFCRRGADESFETGARRKNDPSSLFRRFARAYALAAQADPQSRRELSRHRRRSLADRRLFCTTSAKSTSFPLSDRSITPTRASSWAIWS